jgi:cyanophycinase
MKKFLLFIFISLHAGSVTAFPKEMILAGGAMKICSSLSSGECKDAKKEFSEARKTARYQIQENHINELLNPGFWHSRAGAPASADLRIMLLTAKQKARNDIYSASALENILEKICVIKAKVINCTRGDTTPVWEKLLDEEQSFILSTFEIPEFKQGKRIREIASIDDSKNPHGAAILKTFVEAAAKRSPGKRPRVLFVTASSADPYDAVDFYFSALKQAGAEPVWWPIDQALAAVVYGKKSCAELPQFRIEKLALANRERVFPDLTAMQKMVCENPQALAEFPLHAQGIFFSGGDQWRLRQAMFDEKDQPNVWLKNLRLAFNRGDIVVGGTSAGSAVQSGVAMLSNGSSKHAVNRGAKISAPISPGCERTKRCPTDMQEDDLSYWPAGGLALADSLVFDTHFSERARELRLLRLLHTANANIGIGIDETSAMHLTWQKDQLQIEALGSSGAWLFDTQAFSTRNKKIAARVHYFAPGRQFIWKNNQLSSLSTTPASDTKVTAEKNIFEDALQAGALRALAQQMTSNDAPQATLKADTAKVTLSTTPDTNTWVGPQGQIGVTHLILELSIVP